MRLRLVAHAVRGTRGSRASQVLEHKWRAPRYDSSLSGTPERNNFVTPAEVCWRREVFGQSATAGCACRPLSKQAQSLTNSQPAASHPLSPSRPMADRSVTLRRDENQARGLGRFALDFLAGRLGEPGEGALRRVELFHLDSIACAVSAIAGGTSAPSVLRAEALEYPCEAAEAAGAVKGDRRRGVPLFGSRGRVMPEKAVVANCSAAREWDANGTNFGYNPRTRAYAAASSATTTSIPSPSPRPSSAGCDGRQTLLAMLLPRRNPRPAGRGLRAQGPQDRPRRARGHRLGRGLWGDARRDGRADRVGHRPGRGPLHSLPRDPRTASSSPIPKAPRPPSAPRWPCSAMQRAMRGFVGPADIFRNPQAIFCLFEPPAEPDASPFDLELPTAGDDFAVMGMHFKLGLYEHQSAGAIQGLIDLLAAHPAAARRPRQAASACGSRSTSRPSASSATRTSATRARGKAPTTRWSTSSPRCCGRRTSRTARVRHGVDRSLATSAQPTDAVDLWRELMLLPADYNDASLFDPLTRSLMEKIEFRHGGPEYDAKYPDGIPTSLEIEHAELGTLLQRAGDVPRRPRPQHERTPRRPARAQGPAAGRTGLARRRRPDGTLHATSADKSAAEIRDLYDFELLRGGETS